MTIRRQKCNVFRAARPCLLLAVALVLLGELAAQAQPYPNRLPPPGWTVHPEVVYPSGYRRTVQSVPTVQRIYMWPQYWPDVPYPVDYGAVHEEHPPIYVEPAVSPHDPNYADPAEIDVPRAPQRNDVPNLDPEWIPPPVPEPTSQRRPPQGTAPHREATPVRTDRQPGTPPANPPRDRQALAPRPAEIHPPVQSEFHIPDTTPPPQPEETIQLATPEDRSHLPPAARQPLSSLPAAREHREQVQSVDESISGSDRPNEEAPPIRDAIPPYSAVAPPREQPPQTQAQESRGLFPALSRLRNRQAEDSPAEESTELAPEPPAQTDDAPEPQPVTSAQPTPVERPPVEVAALPERDAVEMEPIQSVMQRNEQPEPIEEEQEFRVPDVDAGQPDDQIVAAFQPPEEEENTEPILPAEINEPIRIVQEQPELMRCPACDDDVVAESMAGWVDPCCYCSPVRRTPEMLGDVFLAAQCEEVEVGGGTLTTSFPAMSLGQKVAENNNPLPRHRVYYTFNWFNDAIDYEFMGGGGTVSDSESVYRHTVGVELPFCCHAFSVELRVPIEHRINERQTVGGDNFFMNFAGFGNVMINTKALMGETDCFAWSAGLGIELPTGRDVSSGVNQFVVHVENEAVHLHPYVAFVWAPHEKLFFESFTQLDVTTKGNRVTLEDTNMATTQTLGPLNSSRVLFVDAMAGYWIYCDNPCRKIHSLASLVEVHYVTALDPGEELTGTLGTGDFFLCNGAVHHGGIDTVNLTLGLHAECGHCSAFRVAGVFPVTDDQLFSSELIVQWNQRM